MGLTLGIGGSISVGIKDKDENNAYHIDKKV